MKSELGDRINFQKSILMVPLVTVVFCQCALAGESCMIDKSNVKEWEEVIRTLRTVDGLMDCAPKSKLNDYIDWSLRFAEETFDSANTQIFNTPVPPWIQDLGNSPEHDARLKKLAGAVSTFAANARALPTREQLVPAEYPFGKFRGLVELQIVRSQHAFREQKYRRALDEIYVAWQLNDVCLRKTFGISSLVESSSSQRKLTNYLCWLLPQLPKPLYSELTNFRLDELPPEKEFIQQQLTSTVLTYKQYDEERENVSKTLLALDSVFAAGLAEDDLAMIADYRRLICRIPHPKAPLLPRIMESVYCRKQANLDRFILNAFSFRTENMKMSDAEVRKSLLRKTSLPVEIELGTRFISVKLNLIEMPDELAAWMFQTTMRLNYPGN